MWILFPILSYCLRYYLRYRVNSQVELFIGAMNAITEFENGLACALGDKSRRAEMRSFIRRTITTICYAKQMLGSVAQAVYAPTGHAHVTFKEFCAKGTKVYCILATKVDIETHPPSPRDPLIFVKKETTYSVHPKDYDNPHFLFLLERSRRPTVDMKVYKVSG